MKITNDPTSDLVMIDPLKMIRRFWPNVVAYREQKDILYSVEEHRETIVPAANQMGKDYITALIVLLFYIRRMSARVVTTSVDFSQLELVLWGEMKSFIQSAEYRGKRVVLPLRMNHMDIRRKRKDGTLDPKGYLIGKTATDQASLQGHHLARLPNGGPTTLAVYDEGSGISQEMYTATRAWRHRLLVIGNCYPCRNYFYTAAKEGDLWVDDIKIRNVIQIKAEHSPNVRLALSEIDKGKKPSNKMLIPGVVTYEDYQIRRKTWDPITQTIGLDAEFYEGSDVMLYPKDRINASSQRAILNTENIPVSLGVDPASGGDSTSFAESSNTKLVNLESLKTPDTQTIVDIVVTKIERNNLEPKMVNIDSGGGGLQIAHQLRRRGYPVRVVNFGSAFKMARRAGVAPVKVRDESEEKQKAFKNIRAFLFYLLSLRLDPGSGYELFDIPEKLLKYGVPGNATLREQMEPIPLLFDDKGIIYMLSKSRKSNIPGAAKDKQITLTELIGHSPDELEAVLLSLYAQYNKPKTIN